MKKLTQPVLNFWDGISTLSIQQEYSNYSDYVAEVNRVRTVLGIPRLPTPTLGDFGLRKARPFYEILPWRSGRKPPTRDF